MATHTLNIDWRQLHAMTGADPLFEQELLQLYLDDSAHHIQRIEMAIRAHDSTLTQQLAHHVKGASANLGIQSLRSVAAQLEVAARQEEMSLAESLLRDLRSQLQWLKSYLANQVIPA